MKLLLPFALIALSFVSCRVDAGGASHRGTIKRIIAYADSYTDDGNDYAASGWPPSPPYWKGRFSNGPTWLDIVAQNTSVQVLNHAFGGATSNNDYIYYEANNFTVPGLVQQIDTLPVPLPDATSDLYVLFIGYNDLFGLFSPGNYHPVKNYTYHTVADNVVLGIKMLQTKYNATQFAVFTCPPFDKFPNPANGTAAKHLIDDYNRDLAHKVKRVRGAHVAVLDDHAWFEKQLAHPERLGLQTNNGSCINMETMSVCDNADTYFFWDMFHPTRIVHRAFGEWAMSKFARLYGIH
ncbi:SGNH hydrolase-type esterase domain-containing protein [Gongronella butleri]|nr:SGNH hydrolase-type esterase domain-containing protein [Gongronella butleri]